MNFSIDARGSNLYKGSGIGTYIENLVREMLNIDTTNKYNIFWSGDVPKFLEKKNANVILTSKKHGMFFEKYYYPNYLSNHNIDFHHIPQNGIGLNKDYNVPCIVTIHDLIPYTMPETVGAGYLERFLSDMPYIIKNCNGILTVSEYSKRDILRFFPNFPSEKIIVTPLAANNNYKPLDKQECANFLNSKYKFGFPYILYVGGFSKRKNVKELIIAFDKISSSLVKDYRLVLLGSLKDQGEELKEFCKELSSYNKIIFTGFIEDNELPIFYNCADLYVYPTLYEGFGLPILEAMSCKTPVISSNCTSLPEVALNDSAILLPPNDIDTLATSMINVLNNADLLLEYGEKGYKNSLNFTWSNTAKATISAYKKFVI